MRASFHLQDPTHTETRYLSEVLVEHLQHDDAEALDVVVAFATVDGLNAIFEDPDFRAFAQRGSIRFTVGLDAITLPEALDVLAWAQTEFPDFRAEVFDNLTSRLFHPKLARLTRDDGSSTVIVGSGNATVGGLQGNFEAFVVIDLDSHEAEFSGGIDAFFERHANDLRGLDEQAYELASANRRLIRRREDLVEVGTGRGHTRRGAGRGPRWR